MSFKITIIDNKTGKVLTDIAEAEAIIGAVSTEKDMQSLACISTSIIKILATIGGVEQVIRQLEDDSAELKFLHSMTGNDKLMELLDGCRKDKQESRSEEH